MNQDFDEARRKAVARGWASSPLDQESYAAKHNISARTLREWVRRYGVTDRPGARALAIINTAITQLQALRAGLDAEEACQVGEENEPAPDPIADCQERHAGPEAACPVTSSADTPAKPVPAGWKPMPRHGFFWG